MTGGLSAALCSAVHRAADGHPDRSDRGKKGDKNRSCLLYAPVQKGKNEGVFLGRRRQVVQAAAAVDAAESDTLFFFHFPPFQSLAVVTMRSARPVLRWCKEHARCFFLYWYVQFELYFTYLTSFLHTEKVKSRQAFGPVEKGFPSLSLSFSMGDGKPQKAEQLRRRRRLDMCRFSRWRGKSRNRETTLSRKRLSTCLGGNQYLSDASL